MASNSTAEPPLFTGNGAISSDAWLRLFVRWTIGRCANDGDRLLGFETFLAGDAVTWWEATPAADRDSWEKAKKLLKTKYTAQPLPQPKALTDTIMDFQDVLAKPPAEAAMCDCVHVTLIGEDGRPFETDIPAVHEWARQIWRAASAVPDADISPNAKGRYLRRALPHPLSVLVSASLTSLPDMVTAILELRPDAILAMLDDRLQLAEMRARLVKMEMTQYTPPQSRESSHSPPMRQEALRSSLPTSHLVFQDSTDGRAAYRQAMHKYGSAEPTAYGVWPLTPGTLPPGYNICSRCGMHGHLQSACTGRAVPDKEATFCRMSSAEQRKQNRQPIKTQAVDIEDIDPCWYSDEEDGEAAKDVAMA